MRLLFEPPEAAREVAFMLQCKYDGFTMITLLPAHDTLALRTAIESLALTYVLMATTHYPLVLSLTADARSQVSDQQAERLSRKAK